ncbi:MAG TPA: DNA mismatch repair endonuclease MutL [Thermoanaerobaculia bacterium]|nr:DNA mismatch repair endonuclease MutL [Thermoanaerobaculia bacterium]
MPQSAMAAIRILPERIVNRIAAGEVIERPAAAVKELVENALDAGASRISVALDGGGIDRIEVVDDGCGMDAAGLALAVQRHATSKLADDDLVRIATLGFRGEALPSIGAAARLAISSRPVGADSAQAISVEGGVVSAVAPSAGAPGTRVVVRDLFFATPARRKFLKHPRTEADHAEAAVRRLALTAPGVAFRLESDGRTLFDLPRQDRAARVAALLGPDAAAVLLPVAGERGALRIEGFAASPAVTRATGAAQGLTVNGRPVADPVLKTAVRVAYRDVIAAGRHPVVALYLELPAEELDVNVHPAKAELRFRDAGAVRALVIGALSRALGTILGSGVGGAVPAPRPALHLVHSRPGGALPPPPALPGFAPGFADVQLPLGGSPVARFWPAPAALPEHPLGAPVAQVLDTYVIAVASDGSLVLVDQHAAHERLTHEALKQEMLAGGVRSQPLLLPAVVELPPADAARLLAQADALARLGLEIEGFGGGAVLVRALPAALGAPEPAPLLRDLADQLAEADEATALEARLDAAIARMACHGSIRAGRRLMPAEMDALLRRMEATPRAATCSHGRPTFLKLTQADIERLFGRR